MRRNNSLMLSNLIQMQLDKHVTLDADDEKETDEESFDDSEE